MIIMSSPKLIYAHGKTYDISNFISKHPGGENCLKNSIGKDCSKHYDFHRKKGKNEWKKYEVKKKENSKCVIL